MTKETVRISIDYVINITVSAFLTIAGVTVVGISFFASIFLDTAIIKLLREEDCSSGWELLELFLLLFLYLALIIGYFSIGIIPLLTGLMIGTLSSVARFRFSEHGTVITKQYKKLMTASNVTSLVVGLLYAVIWGLPMLSVAIDLIKMQ